jgi:hypothetical protein
VVAVNGGKGAQRVADDGRRISRRCPCGTVSPFPHLGRKADDRPLGLDLAEDAGGVVAGDVRSVREIAVDALAHAVDDNALAVFDLAAQRSAVLVFRMADRPGAVLIAGRFPRPRGAGGRHRRCLVLV